MAYPAHNSVAFRNRFRVFNLAFYICGALCWKKLKDVQYCTTSSRYESGGPANVCSVVGKKKEETSNLPERAKVDCESNENEV